MMKRIQLRGIVSLIIMDFSVGVLAHIPLLRNSIHTLL